MRPPEPTRRAEPTWLEPYPDVLLEGSPTRPPGRRHATRRRSGRAGVRRRLQHLPPRQRAVLVLRDVLGFRRSEVGRDARQSQASVNSALQRARATLENACLAAGANARRCRLPHASASSSGTSPTRSSRRHRRHRRRCSPTTPADNAARTLEYQGEEAIAGFLDDRAARRGTHYRLVPTRANGQPAFGCYLPDPQAPIAHPYGLLVLTLNEDAVSAITWFADRCPLRPLRASANASHLGAGCPASHRDPKQLEDASWRRRNPLPTATVSSRRTRTSSSASIGRVLLAPENPEVDSQLADFASNPFLIRRIKEIIDRTGEKISPASSTPFCAGIPRSEDRSWAFGVRDDSPSRQH